jgi:ribulose 1,5-bisphosphate synthetase/thiazole synthase
MIKEERINKITTKLPEYNYDFVIVGGVLSGVCCAIAEARNDFMVALIQDRPVF